MGIYPHLNVIDAAFSVIREGRQHNVRASRCLRMERMDTQAGAISVEVVEPLRRLRVRVDDRANGVRAELVIMSPSSEQLAEIARLAATGQLRIEIAETLPLAEFQQALALSESGHARGKIILEVAR